MPHYHPDQWRLYKQNRLDLSQRRRMEKHLDGCELCLQAYLSTLEQQEQKLARLLLPADFNTRTLCLVEKRKQQLIKVRRSRLLVNYAAAALVTLALTVGGVFDAVARGAPVLVEETHSVSRVINSSPALGWPGQFVQAFETQLNKLGVLRRNEP